MDNAVTLTIDRLGGLGDGVASLNGLPVMVPYTLPQDVVRVRITQKNNKRAVAVLEEVLTPSPLRQPSMCGYFTRCGGCDLLHANPSAYSDFKEQQLQTALARAGVKQFDVAPLRQFGTAHRRRAEFSVQYSNGTATLGFLQAGSHTITPIQQCPVLEPALSDFIPHLNVLLGDLPSVIERAQITQCSNGLDMHFTLSQHLPKSAIPVLEQFSAEHGVIRISSEHLNDIRTASQKNEPTIRCGKVDVPLPVRGFVQASAAAQHAMAALVMEHARGQRVIDLYCGIGSFTFPLLEKGLAVLALEGHSYSIKALKSAATHYSKTQQLHADVRDLFKQPVTAKELSGLDTAILNPPRNGAEPQAKALAKSGIPTVIIVSCSMQALERDLKHLISAGYKVTYAAPIDQFHGTAHLEAVVVCNK